MEIQRLDGLTGYQEGWDAQRALHADVVAGRAPDTVLLLEHPPTYTAGKRTAAADRPTDGTPVVEVDRGGRITWHGPGQLVGYPIVRLGADRGTVDVVRYVRRLEEALVAVCADVGLAAVQVEGRSGVWVPADPAPVDGTSTGRPERKVAAIGIRVAQGTTMHGFALNADCDLSAFAGIVPCGIADAGVTSLTAELGRRVAVDEVEPLVRARLAEVLSPAAA